MAYKTILTVLSDPAQLPLLDRASELADALGGHLDVLCLGVDPSPPGYMFPDAMAHTLQRTLAEAADHARDLQEAATRRLNGCTGISFGIEGMVAQSGGLSGLVGLRARYADLVVLARPYGPGAPAEAEQITEAALYQGGAPVLVLPDTSQAIQLPKRVLIGWNQSVEAMAAVRRALPLLVRADEVQIAVIDPRGTGPERADPGGALAQMLARHGVRADIAVLASGGASVSEVLNRRMTEFGAGLLVMGAYSHSRLREAILGGATRNMLQKAQAPVLLAR